jgi:hypothetical protein
VSTDKEISSWYDIFLLFGGIVAVLNFIKAFKKQPKEVESELEKIIIEKDKIIERQQKQIEQYQRLLDDDY